MLTNDSKLEQIISTIRSVITPQRVILFGSAARGQMGPDSDLDLLIVVPNGTHRRKTAQAVYRAFFDQKIEFSVDLVVATESDLVEHKDDFWTVIHPALRHGKILYAA